MLIRLIAVEYINDAVWSCLLARRACLRLDHNVNHGSNMGIGTFYQFGGDFEIFLVNIKTNEPFNKIAAFLGGDSGVPDT